MFDNSLIFLADQVYPFLHTALSFIIIISIIVFIHEFGHYIVAKKCGVKIDSFSIGFGKEIFGWEDGSGTRWKISVVPLGGYVKMFGDEGAASTPDSEKLATLTKEEEKIAFHTQPLLAKTAIVFAGPLFNFILAIIILTFFFVEYGKPETAPEVGSVTKDSAAYKAGLKEGDVITEIGGFDVEWFKDIQNVTTMNPDIELSLTYLRNGVEIKGMITPIPSEVKDMFGDTATVGKIGISSGSVSYKKMTYLTAPLASVKETYSICARTMQAVGQMITGTRSADQLSGILRIGDYSGKAVEKGWEAVFWFMAILSINLGLINLFPIPMLDGGHLLFYAVEAASGKPLADRVQEYAFRVGFVLLATLMIFATYNDLKHFGIL